MPKPSLKHSLNKAAISDDVFDHWNSQFSWLGTVLVDRDSDLILKFNQCAVDLLAPSHDLETLQSLKFSRFLPKEVSGLRSLQSPQGMADGSYFEHFLQRDDESIFPAQILVKQIKFENKNLVMIIFSDVTAQKRMQRDLEAKQEGLIETLEDLTKKNRELQEMSQKVLESQSTLVQSSKMAALGEMASGVAHEINNPLAIIRGTASLIRESISAGRAQDPDKMVKSLLRIEDTVKRIAKIVSGLRSFSRNSAKDPMELVTASQIIDDTFALCLEKFKNNNVDLRYNPGVFGEIRLTARAAQLSQVLINLLNNAYDAIEGMSGKWIDVTLDVKDATLYIVVTDCGPGIPPHVVEKMMQPFFTTKEVGKGTGLGLSISKGIVEDHHGKFYYDSKCPNTRFIIELPILK